MCVCVDACVCGCGLAAMASVHIVGVSYRRENQCSYVIVNMADSEFVEGNYTLEATPTIYCVKPR